LLPCHPFSSKLLRLTPFLKKAHTAYGLLIKKPEASWALRLPAWPGRLKARLKALGLAGPVSNTAHIHHTALIVNKAKTHCVKYTSFTLSQSWRHLQFSVHIEK
jgi:hypothetical protein